MNEDEIIKDNNVPQSDWELLNLAEVIGKTPQGVILMARFE